MCSDTGIKQLLLRKFTPLLNTLIDNYLRRFNLPVTVEFDELFKHKLSSVEGIGHKHGLLSKGQRKRIDIAILFAMVDLIKLMGSFNCNLLILDEFADDGLDSKGFRDVVHTIREVADRDKKSITIISHKNEDVLYDNLDSIYELELRNHFSVLRKVNNI
jgi:ABC-type multidrug transport system ATPase subunit